MPFIHPAIFGLGAALAALPIVISLLNRRRFRVKPWAAMQFLLESVKQNRRRLRLEELILLAFRCLIILTLAAGTARLTGCGAMNILPGGGGTRTVVFVLDDSFSMAQRVASAEIFQAATAELFKEIEKLPKSDKVSIILASASQEDDPYFKPTHLNNADMDSLRLGLAALKPSDRRADLAGALASAGRILAEEVGKRRLYIFTDCRKADLVGANDALAGQFKAIKSGGADVMVLDYGLEPRNNITIESVQLLDKFVVARNDMRLRVTLRNNSPAASADVPVNVTANFSGEDGVRDVTLPVRIVSGIEAGQSVGAEYKVTPPFGGSAVIKVTIGDDELAADNSNQLALDIPDSLRVLIADGRIHLADPTESESYTLATAIGSDEISTPTVIPADGLEGENLSDYDVVMLLDVGDLAAERTTDGRTIYPQLSALERYVRSGGGLAIFTGDNVNMSFYNGPLYSNGLGLSPYRVSARLGDPNNREEYFRLAPKSIKADFAVRQFQGEASIRTMLVRFYAFTVAKTTMTAMSSDEVKAPRVLARFTDPDNSPAIAARQYGKGTVLMYYTTASPRWNDWAADEPPGMYVDPMLDMVRYLARSRRVSGGALVGLRIACDVDRQMRDWTAHLQTPGYPDVEQELLAPIGRHELLVAQMNAVADSVNEESPQQAAALKSAARDTSDAFGGRNTQAAALALTSAVDILKEAAGDQAAGLRRDLQSLDSDSLGELLGEELRYERADQAGVYTLKFVSPDARKTRTVFFARNVDPAEGNLATGGEDAMTDALGDGEFEYFPRQAASSVSVDASSGDKEYWMYAIAAMLVLLAVENYLGQKFGHYAKRQENGIRRQAPADMNQR